MGRDVKYIQLPPLPEDIEMPALEAIWLIARMNPEQRKDALKQIEAIAGTEKDGKADYEAVEAILDKYAYCEANRPGLRSKTAAFCF